MNGVINVNKRNFAFPSKLNYEPLNFSFLSVSSFRIIQLGNRIYLFLLKTTTIIEYIHRYYDREKFSSIWSADMDFIYWSVPQVEGEGMQ